MCLEDYVYLVREQDIDYLQDIVSTLEASNPERQFVSTNNTDENVNKED